MRRSSLLFFALLGVGSFVACAQATRDFGSGGFGGTGATTTASTGPATTGTGAGSSSTTTTTTGTGGTGGATMSCPGSNPCSSPAGCPAPTTACIENTCVGGCCGTAPTPKGTACTDHGGVVCDGNGKCISGHCTDGLQDADETDVDCGGSCSPCPAGKKCMVNADCAGAVCKAGICATPTCSDGVENGNETDVDCGGGACPPCATGKSCKVASDCQSMMCDPTTLTCSAPLPSIAIESVAGSCYTMPGEVDSLAQSVLAAAGFNVQIVDGNALATQAGIGQFAVVVFGAGHLSCDWDWSLFDAQLQAYVQGGGGVVVTGWAASYMASNTKNETYPGLASILPMFPGTASPDGQLDTVLSGHPITSGLGNFTNPSYTSPGAGMRASATPLLEEGNTITAAAWTLGLNGRVVYLGPIYLADFADYPNKGLLDGSIPSAKQLFVNSVLWAAHKI